MAKNRRSAPRVAVGLAVALVVAGLALTEGVLAQDAVSARQALMKTNGAALRAIDGIIRKGGNAAEVAAPAERIAGLAAQLPALFPAGTDQGDTEAKPAIWQKFDDFQAKAGNLQYQAALLASAAQSGDLATVRAQFEKVASACSDCHRSFRQKK